jgi:hypothetical protein
MLAGLDWSFLQAIYFFGLLESSFKTLTFFYLNQGDTRATHGKSIPTDRLESQCPQLAASFIQKSMN